eukprot:scaffold16638_cov120-Isochrysis_galbana.AAC.5
MARRQEEKISSDVEAGALAARPTRRMYYLGRGPARRGGPLPIAGRPSLLCRRSAGAVTGFPPTQPPHPRPFPQLGLQRRREV